MGAIPREREFPGHIEKRQQPPETSSAHVGPNADYEPFQKWEGSSLRS